MQSCRAEGYGRMSLLLFLKHYIRYYNIKPADDLRVTSYCDNSSLLEAGNCPCKARRSGSRSVLALPSHEYDRTSFSALFRQYSRSERYPKNPERDHSGHSKCSWRSRARSHPFSRHGNRTAVLSSQRLRVQCCFVRDTQPGGS
jgi:hypothetical protein